MSTVQVADQTFIAAPAHRVGEAVGDRSSWRRWWPDLQLTVVEDRADKGIRWTVAGPLTGTMEIWLEPMLDGVVMHYFLHAEPSGASRRRRWRPNPMRSNVAEMIHRRRVAGKEMAFEIKAALERSRPVGVCPLTAG